MSGENVERAATRRSLPDDRLQTRSCEVTESGAMQWDWTRVIFEG